MLLIFLLFVSIKQAIPFALFELDIVEELIEENIVSPRPLHGNVLINSLFVHTGLYSYCVFMTERGKDGFKEVEPIYNRGRPRYTIFYLTDTKIGQLKFLFDWNDEDIKDLKASLKDNKYVMETFFELFKKTRRDISELRHFKRGPT